jgi:hypothetical protein
MNALAKRMTLAVALGAAANPVFASDIPVAAPVAAEKCELRVFPTLEAGADTRTLVGSFGLIGALVDAAATEKQDATDGAYLKEALAPPQQVKALSSFDLVGALKLPSSNVVFEEPLPKKSLNSKQRLTGSTVNCYFELVITKNQYMKEPLRGGSLSNSFVLRDFREVKPRAGVHAGRVGKVHKGHGDTGLKVFPPETTYMTEEAEKELHGAFAANVREFAAKIKK